MRNSNPYNRLRRRVGKQTVSENLLYAVVWILIYMSPIVSSGLMAEFHIDWSKVFVAWIKITPYFVVFFVHNMWLVSRLLLERRMYMIYFASSLLLILAVYVPIDIYENLWAERFGVVLSDFEFYVNFLASIAMFGLNAAIKMFYKSIRDEQNIERLKRQNLQAEMDSLKYQINPHFFMNTLNNIHALIDIDSEKAKQSVIDLSKMMRYVLYDSNDNRTSLARDLQFTCNYIELMRIRYTGNIDITFDFPPHIPPSAIIPPLLMVVFVENAFKHGVSYNRRSFIDMRLALDDEHIIFTIRNSRTTKPANHKEGIGLENVVKRLDLIYKDRYSLDIDTSHDDSYGVILVIPVNYV